MSAVKLPDPSWNTKRPCHPSNGPDAVRTVPVEWNPGFGELAIPAKLVTPLSVDRVVVEQVLINS